MKSFFKKMFISSVGLAALTLCGCGEATSSTPAASSSTKTSEYVQEFVAVTSSDWDAETTIGSYKFTLALNLSTDNTLQLAGTCTAKVEQSSGGGSSWGANRAVADATGGDAASEAASEEAEDLTTHDFKIAGTWSEETGYGYILNMSDAVKTVIHTDFIKNQGRHQFYYSVAVGADSATVLFQAKDSGYRSKLASDYKVWDERDAQYIFTAVTTGNNSSVAYAYLYLHKSDNSVVYNTANGSERSVTLGLTWSMDGNLPVVREGMNEYKAEASINADHPGFRLAYSSKAFFCSTNASVAWQDMTNGDFDGKTLYQFTGSYTTSGPDASTTEVQLNLAEGNKMFLYSGGSLSKKGTYTFENDTFVLAFDGEEPATVTKNEAGSYVYSFQIVTSSFFGTSTIDVVLTYTPEA